MALRDSVSSEPLQPLIPHNPWAMSLTSKPVRPSLRYFMMASFGENSFGEMIYMELNRMTQTSLGSFPADPPFAGGDDRPDAFDQAEGPCALKKSVNGAKHAGNGEAQHEPLASALKRIADDHRRYGKKPERSQAIHGALPLWTRESAEGTGFCRAGGAGFSMEVIDFLMLRSNSESASMKVHSTRGRSLP